MTGTTAPATRVLLVRHGTFDGMHERLAGRSDIGLNRDGRLQAAAAGETCRGEGATRLLCSPRRRAMETARILADALQLTPRVVRAFDEVDYGEWTGRTFDALQDDPRWRHYNEQRSTASIPGGESPAAITRRVRRGLAALRRTCPGEAVIVATHAEIIRAVLLLVHGRTWDDWASFSIEPCSMTPVVGTDRWRAERAACPP